MIKTFMKHYIYDFCINVFFSRLKSNFINTPSKGMPKSGDFYSRISHIEDDEHYYNCVIEDVEKRKNKLGSVYYIIYLTYEYCTGEVFEDGDWLLKTSDPEGAYYDQEDFEEEFEELFTDEKSHTDYYDEGKLESVDFDDMLSLNYKFYRFYK